MSLAGAPGDPAAPETSRAQVPRESVLVIWAAWIVLIPSWLLILPVVWTALGQGLDLHPRFGIPWVVSIWVWLASVGPLQVRISHGTLRHGTDWRTTRALALVSGAPLLTGLLYAGLQQFSTAPEAIPTQFLWMENYGEFGLVTLIGVTCLLPVALLALAQWFAIHPGPVPDEKPPPIEG